MPKHTITFIPDNKKIIVESGTTVLAAAISANVGLASSCGGDGVCGKCKVVLKNGRLHSEPSGKISPEERQRGMHLACLSLVESDIEVEIPPESRMEMGALSEEAMALRMKGVFDKAEDVCEVKPSLGEGVFARAALVKKVFLGLSPPDFDDKISDLERLYRLLSEKTGEARFETGLANVRRLGELLRASDWKVTAAVGYRGPYQEVIVVEPQDRSGKNYGLAFDIGTTTVNVQLVDLNSCCVLGTKASYNRQAAYGSDVISRIIYSQAPDGLEKLHHAVVDIMNEMAGALIREHGVDTNDVTCASVAGNTTMIHLLLKIDPTYVRQEPYVPTLNSVPVLKAVEAGIRINPHGLLFCLPGVASYVGGDITAGIIACDMHRSEKLNLLIDVGTNGEIALGGAVWLISCAASAGPAFEGSGMSCGLRATGGAIVSAKIDEATLDVAFETIGGAKARGICGSGYIDLVSELLRCGVLDKNGRIDAGIKSKRIRRRGSDVEFVVAFADEAQTGRDIVINEVDLDNLKRAKGAIYAGISILMRHMGVSGGDLDHIFVAGGFGTSLDIESAVRIGLLPDVARDKYIFVGNSSLAGARMCLLSREAAEASETVARGITYFELSTDPQYMDEYTAALFFPHTDSGRFPSVK